MLWKYLHDNNSMPYSNITNGYPCYLFHLFVSRPISASTPEGLLDEGLRYPCKLLITYRRSRWWTVLALERASPVKYRGVPRVLRKSSRHPVLLEFEICKCCLGYKGPLRYYVPHLFPNCQLGIQDYRGPMPLMPFQII